MADHHPAPPPDFDALRARLSRAYGELSPRLRQIAEFALARPDAVALGTVAQLARRMGVPPSALVRFAQALGFSGFSQMQRLFRERLVARIPAYPQRIREARRAGTEESEPLSDFLFAARASLDALDGPELRGRIAEAARRIVALPGIAVLGMRRSFPVAAYLAYAFARLGRPARLLDGLGGMLQQQAAALSPECGLLAVSYPPYAPETLELAGLARRAGAPVLALTDAPLSPLAREAEVALCVRDPEVEGVRALSASMTVASALVLAVGRLLAADGT